MSDDEEVKKEPEPEQPGKKFFISHINSYTGMALIEEIKNKDKVREEHAAHSFSGTLQKGKNISYNQLNPTAPEGCDKIVEMSRTRAFRESILESDVIIYDLMTNEFEEVDYVIKTLKTSNLENNKTLIILSSVHTWVNTPPKYKKELEDGEEPEEGGADEEVEEEETEEEEVNADEDGEGNEDKPKKKKILFFKETDFQLRVPHDKYFKMKNLETLALSAPKTQPKLKIHILCCGIRYGNGESVFYDHFQKAWMQQPDFLNVIGTGENLIPTIHVNDIGRITNRLVMKEMTKEYIFAVDRTKKPTQKNII
jgi:hypothetical protein